MGVTDVRFNFADLLILYFFVRKILVRSFVMEFLGREGRLFGWVINRDRACCDSEITWGLEWFFGSFFRL